MEELLEFFSRACPADLLRSELEKETDDRLRDVLGEIRHTWIYGEKLTREQLLDEIIYWALDEDNPTAPDVPVWITKSDQ